MLRRSFLVVAALVVSSGCLHRPPESGDAHDLADDPETPVADAAAEAVVPESVAEEEDGQVVVESAEIQAEREAEAEFMGTDADSAETGDHAEVPVLADGPLEGHCHAADAPMEEWAGDYDIPIVINEQVEYWITYFQTRGRPWMAKWLARSGRYEPLIRQTLKKYDLPEDLVYLAMIESGFSTHAYSRARAVGPWQFISATGRQYGLTHNWWMDERRDPALSTDAAARHLKDLYAEFGDWYLAWSAYNAGAGKVRRAIDRYGTRDFWELCSSGRYLRSETKNYVPKLIAAALIAKHPGHFGFHEIDYHDALAFEEVEVSDATGLDVVAKVCGVAVADVEVLNPALRRFCTPPGTQWKVRVPEGSAEGFDQKLAEIPAKERVTFRRHVVRSGDTLSEISERYRTSVRGIMSMNGIRNPRSIRAGTTLVIPIPAYRAPALRVVHSKPAPTKKKTTSVAARSSDPPKGRIKKTHVMQPGETLWGISQLYGVSVRDLKGWNHVWNHRRLQAGRKLVVYVRPGAPGASTTGVRVASTKTESAPTGGVVYYTVQSGDTVWGIARQHGADPIDVLKLNGLSRRSRIHPGDVLKLPQKK